MFQVSGYGLALLQLAKRGTFRINMPSNDNLSGSFWSMSLRRVRESVSTLKSNGDTRKCHLKENAW